MKDKKGEKIPSEVFKSMDKEKTRLLRDFGNLTVAELIENYIFSEAVVETVREPLLILHPNLTVKSANNSFFKAFKVTKEETMGRKLYELGNGQWNIPELRTLLETILPKNTSFNDFEVRHTFESIGQKLMLLNARRIVFEGHKTRLILLAIEDKTEQKKLAELLQRETEINNSILDSLDDGYYIIDRHWRYAYVNRKACDLAHKTKEEMLGKTE